MAAITLPFLEDDTPFPSTETALTQPDGLLAFGGDLSVTRLVTAYQSGIFPWFSDGEPLLWWSPSTRAIIKPSAFHLSKSLTKTLKKKPFRVTLNHAFNEVIVACASVPRYLDSGEISGTWITHEMVDAYIRLHQNGYAHSIEVWQGDELVGGLYGVVTDNVFCGESMFHSVSNASKVAMTALVKLLGEHAGAFIDCQMPTDHLLSLGAQSVPREQFLVMLDIANQTHLPASLWVPRDVTECLV